jgi:hypothetical protein
MRILAGCLAAALLLAPTPRAVAYPLDAYRETGITRLEAYRLAKDHLLKTRNLYEGSLLPAEDVRLTMLAHRDYDLPEKPDAELTAAVRDLLGEDAGGYGLALLDITRPESPRYAEIAGRRIQNPGSVGKIVVALAWMQALADVYPDDVEARKRVLRESMITANEFIRTDSHVVPFWNPGDPRVVKRPIEEGDTASVWTYLDWMCSSSSNAAAGMLMAHLMLLKHFGEAYPPSPAEADAFFANAGNVQKSRLFLDAIRTPITRNGLDVEKLRQGSFFTRRGKQLVSGTNSVATPRELLRFALYMEQGKLVDEWSSLEIKRLLYLTDRRIRYASSPALADAALYFKSGSLYSCQPEPGFECKKYHGNKRNYMNSLTIVETTDRKQPLHYISVVLSNVLRKNSAVEHQTLATRIHRLIQSAYDQSLSSQLRTMGADPELRSRAKDLIDTIGGGSSD